LLASASQARRMVTSQESPPHADAGSETSSFQNFLLQGFRPQSGPKFLVTPVFVGILGRLRGARRRPGATGGRRRRLRGCRGAPPAETTDAPRTRPRRDFRRSTCQEGQNLRPRREVQHPPRCLNVRLAWKPPSPPTGADFGRPASGRRPIAPFSRRRFGRGRHRHALPATADASAAVCTRRPGDLTRIADDRVKPRPGDGGGYP